MAFYPRLSRPSRTNYYYLCTPYMQELAYGTVKVYGGLNECIVGNNSQDGSSLPNCVGYAWGRWYEFSDERPNLSRGDGGIWYSHTEDGYERTKLKPNLGAVACFKHGTVGSAGHVGIVEKKISETEYITSNSYYPQEEDFILEYLRYEDGTWKRYNYTTERYISGYEFQGFILNPFEPTPTSRKKLPIIYYSRLI